MSEVARRTDDHTAVGIQLDSLNSATNTFRATFDTSTEFGQIRAFAALTDAESLNEHLGETINLVDWVGQAVQLTDENTGEIRDAVRVVLIDDNGACYSAVSDQLIRSLSTLVGIFGPADTWAAPKAIKVTEQRSKGGRRFYQIVPASPAK